MVAFLGSSLDSPQAPLESAFERAASAVRQGFPSLKLVQENQEEAQTKGLQLASRIADLAGNPSDQTVGGCHLA